MIIQQQSPRRLLEVRGRLYELLTHCIPAEIIMKVSFFFADFLIVSE
jgi:replication factor C subunit 3/5